MTAALFLSVPAGAQEIQPAHCYIRSEAPAEAPVVTTNPPPLDGYGTYLSIALSRHACGADASANQSALFGMVERAECTPDSEAWLYALAFLSTDAPKLRQLFVRQFDMSPAEFDDWCEMLSSCEPDHEGRYPQDCFTAMKTARE